MHPIHPPTRLRWLYVDFNSYFASVEQQIKPHLRGKPVVVVPVETDATCAIAASYEAKALGIKTGTPIWEAKRLCPELHCVLANHEHYVQFHERIKQEIARHLPITVTASIDEVACRLMANEAPRAEEIARQIKQGLVASVGAYLTCSIGIAPNKYLAKVATDLHKPDGLTVLTMENCFQRLLPLPLRDLPGIGPNMERRLQRHGITSMRHLLARDAQQLRAAWGNLWGERMWYYLRGFDLPDAVTQRSSIGHSHVLAPVLRPSFQARYVARRLTAKAASRLRREGYYATRFSLSVRVENGPRWACELRLPSVQDTPAFLHALESLWGTMVDETRAAPLKKVSVNLYGLVTAQEAQQPDLFSTLPGGHAPQRARAEQLSRALDAINHRYGRDTVALGMMPAQGRSFSGTKIAFTRIPDPQEFLE